MKTWIPLPVIVLAFMLSGCAAALPLMGFVQPFVLEPASLSLIRIGPPSANVDFIKLNWPGAKEDVPFSLPVLPAVGEFVLPEVSLIEGPHED